MTFTGTSSNPFAGAKWFVDPSSNARTQASAWRLTRPADAAQIGAQRVRTVARGGCIPRRVCVLGELHREQGKGRQRAVLVPVELDGIVQDGDVIHFRFNV